MLQASKQQNNAWIQLKDNLVLHIATCLRQLNLLCTLQKRYTDQKFHFLMETHFKGHSMTRRERNCNTENKPLQAFWWSVCSEDCSWGRGRKWGEIKGSQAVGSSRTHHSELLDGSVSAGKITLKLLLSLLHLTQLLPQSFLLLPHAWDLQVTKKQICKYWDYIVLLWELKFRWCITIFAQAYISITDA